MGVDISLMQKLVERAVQQRLRPLEDQAWAQHWLLVELARQLPRKSLLDAAQRLELQARADGRKDRDGAAWNSWQLYLCQLAGLVDGNDLPQTRKYGG